MKILISKTLPVILTLYWIFSTITSNGQGWVYPTCTCISDNPPGYCYTDKQGKTRCNKYHSNNAGGNNNGWDACICALTHKGTGREETSDGIYPNPLINSTTIYVTVREAQKISLKVFDLSGKLITALVDGSTSAGEHRLEWNATNADAGVYILRLQTPSFMQTKKLFVVK